MLRRPIETVIALAAIVCAASVVDSRSADAQGLLRRIQSRIQSRIAVPPVDPRQPTQPREQAKQSEQPRSPARAARPAAAQSPQALTQRRRVEPSSPPREDVESGKFGGSILAPFAEPPVGNPLVDEPSVNELPRPATDPSSVRPTLGIEVLPSDGASAGVEVVRFHEDSLADDAGLRIGDVIVSIDGVDTPTIADVGGELARKRIGGQIQATVLRGNAAVDLELPLVDPRAFAAKPVIDSSASIAASPAGATDRAEAFDERLGVTVSDAQGLRGAFVRSVAPGTPAAAAGLLVGDRIVSLDGALIANVAALNNRLAHAADGEPFSLRLVRNDGLINKDIQLGDPGPQAVAGASNAAPSAIQGLGSILGGLLGGNPVAKQPRKTDPTGTAPGSTAPGSEKDPLAMGDDPKVQRVGFDKSVNGSEASRGGAVADGPISLTDDPPSLDILELPTPREIEPITRSSPDRAEALRTAEEIRDEIRRLEARLRAVEAEASAGGESNADSSGIPADKETESGDEK